MTKDAGGTLVAFSFGKKNAKGEAAGCPF